MICYAWPDFDRKARALVELFRQHGFRTELVVANTRAARARVRASKCLHIGFWNEFYADSLPARYVFYNAEPLTLKRWSDNEDWMKTLTGALEVWGYAQHHESILDQLGVPHKFVPFGYAPFYDHEYQASLKGLQVAEDIDVLFFGHLTPRRAQLLKDVEQQGCHVHVITYKNPARGVVLDRLIARSKIVLSAFALDEPGSQNVDLARLDRLLSNKRFVIQERPPEALRDAEFEQHVETCAYSEIPERCAWYVRNETARDTKAALGHEWFKTQRAWDSVIPFDTVRALMDGGHAVER